MQSLKFNMAINLKEKLFIKIPAIFYEVKQQYGGHATSYLAPESMLNMF
jgi:hypothetical protein